MKTTLLLLAAITIHVDCDPPPKPPPKKEISQQQREHEEMMERFDEHLKRHRESIREPCPEDYDYSGVIAG
jgi:hypothetical protein